jgi:hypothetical protein
MCPPKVKTPPPPEPPPAPPPPPSETAETFSAKRQGERTTTQRGRRPGTVSSLAVGLQVPGSGGSVNVP